MIIDSLKNTEKYEKLHPLFQIAFDYLKSVGLETIDTGIIELKGKDIFVIVSDSNLKPEADALLEVHNEYIDIQVPINKTETFGWAARSGLREEKSSFDKEKDIQFFDDKKSTLFSVSPGNFVIFFPEDAHAPCIGDGVIRKIVMKLRL